VSSIFMGSVISTRIHLCRHEDTAAFFFKTLIGTYGPTFDVNTDRASQYNLSN